jgi:putative ABC transport system permease protein
VLASMRERLAGRPVEVTPWWALADFYNKTVELFSKQLGVVRFIVAVIIVLSISNTMVMAVLERTWEIGTSMALGVPRRSILALFLVEGLLLGVLGGAIGLALGAAVAALLSAVGIPMPPPPGMAHGFTGGVLFTPAIAAGAFAIAVATTLAASVYPARKASRLPIVDALRHNR